MSAPDGPMVGDELLRAVDVELSALHEHFYGRRPAAVRTRLMEGELLACVMGGVYTEVEKTLIELQRSREVKESRSAFQQAMERRFVEIVERLTGRAVVTYLSTHSVGPDLEVELFFLGPADDPGPVEG